MGMTVRLACPVEGPGGMEDEIMSNPISDWLLEQERKKESHIFVLEWISTFAVALLFWGLLFYEMEGSIRLAPTAATLAALYASVFVYLRLLPVTRCKKCKSLLPLIKQEIGRRHIHDEERCLEIERGGEQYWGHYIDLYYRIISVDIVRYRCAKCHATWEEVEHVPKSEFRRARTITVKD